MAVKKDAGAGQSESRGLRMPGKVWGELDRLAELDQRKTSQYIILLLENHVKEKSKR